MKDWYAEYLAEMARSTELRCAIAFIEGFTRTALEYPDLANWQVHMTELHAKAKAALDETERNSEPGESQP